MRNHRLNAQQTFKLTAWIRDNAARLREENATVLDVMRRVNAVFASDFYATPSNVRNAAKAAGLDITMPMHRAPHQPREKQQSDRADLVGAIAELAIRVSELRRTIDNVNSKIDGLYTALGETPPITPGRDNVTGRLFDTRLPAASTPKPETNGTEGKR